MNQLEEDLEYLNTLIIRMANTVVQNLEEAFEIYEHYDPFKKYDVINDDLVDNLERTIEEECLNIMLRQRPFASDLRIVSGILKLVEDLERLGDHAEDVYTFSMKLKNTEHLSDKGIHRMVEYAMEMVHNAILSFVNKDISLAQKTIDMDDLMDQYYDEEIEGIIQLNREKNCSSAFAIYTTLVIKYIERISDHAVNIAEWVIYIMNGYYKDKQIC